jgi:hypothetical protein
MDDISSINWDIHDVLERLGLEEKEKGNEKGKNKQISKVKVEEMIVRLFRA